MSAVFDAVEAYEAAFSYRDVPAEVDLLGAWFERHHGGAPRRVLELAAGPGDHTLEFARRGVAATALDSSAAMCARVRDRAVRSALPVEVVEADMTGFVLGSRFDLVLLPLDSASLLLTDAAMAALLRCAHEHLTPGGLLITDLAAGGGAKPEWTVETPGATVRTRWGSPDDVYDPATRIEQVHVRITVTPHGHGSPETVVDEVVAARAWTSDHLVRLAPAGGFDLLARYGSMTGDIPATDRHASRDIPVLRRAHVSA
ncbi:hypothetical protein Ade02nite_12320 [Paractinoplanes deccanensis]|uniref:Methyltransferase domain-containing protein n=1 Tax=Paractinoplanes deccanensis TaxID=113561 RepID=A0ABQ3XXY9_9ACTN|nr:class I SAM-dependent methyltransferase [Actinoplanes deccanensis]GID72591.1 hypothetical protein Ade02nite_12320 [Actinoplanes deccanensis]